MTESTSRIVDPIKADLRPSADDLRATPFGQFEYKLVTFGVADTDVAVAHRLTPPFPFQICYRVLQQSAAGSVYYDATATRRPWTQGTIFLRASAPMTAVILLTTPVNTIATQFRE